MYQSCRQLSQIAHNELPIPVLHVEKATYKTLRPTGEASPTISPPCWICHLSII